MATTYETFAIERRDDGIAIVRMNRPDKLNAMNPTFFAEMPRVFEELDADDSVAVCILTGAGKAFSAGGDIVSFQSLDTTPKTRRHLRRVYDAFHAVERAQVPVIGAINGVAYGGGTELTLVCDMVIAARSARFAFREATVGLMPGWGVIRGPDVIGRHWTRWLALTADIIDAEQALSIGLVQQVVDDEALLETALAVAGRISANAPLGVRAAKQFINRDTGGSGMAESIEATALLFTTDDTKDRVAGFVGRDR